MRPTVVIVDDSGGPGSFVRAAVRGSRGRSGSRRRFFRRAAHPGFLAALVLLDVMLPDISGFVVADRLASGGYEGPVVLVSTRRIPKSAVEAAPVAGFLPKDGISGDTLRRFVDTAA